MNKCHRRCTRKGITKKEYLERTNKTEIKYYERKETLGTVYCAGCHKNILCDMVTSEQYYDIEGVLFNDS